MRVRVVGDSDTACALRGYLQKAGDVALWKEGSTDADYTVILEEKPESSPFIIDAVDCDFERSLFRHLRNLSDCRIEVQTKGGVQTDNAVRIVFPSSQGRAVELGVQMGLADLAGPKPVPMTSGSPAPSCSCGQHIALAYQKLLLEKDSQISGLESQIQELKKQKTENRASWLKSWKVGIFAGLLMLGLFYFSTLARSQDGAAAPGPPPSDLPLPIEPSDRERIKDLWVQAFISAVQVQDANIAVEKYTRQAAESKLDVAKRQKELDEINAKIATQIGDFRNKYKAGIEKWCLTRQLNWIPKQGDKPCPAIFESEPSSQPAH